MGPEVQSLDAAGNPLMPGTGIRIRPGAWAAALRESAGSCFTADGRGLPSLGNVSGRSRPAALAWFRQGVPGLLLAP